MELGRSLNLGVDTRRNTARRRRQAADGGRDLLASILIISPADKDAGTNKVPRISSRSRTRILMAGTPVVWVTPNPYIRQNRRDAIGYVETITWRPSCMNR